MRCLAITRKKARPNQPLSERDILKMEIAKEMGIWEQVQKDGWQSLSNADCGRVGGIMKKTLQARKQAAADAIEKQSHKSSPI